MGKLYSSTSKKAFVQGRFNTKQISQHAENNAVRGSSIDIDDRAKSTLSAYFSDGVVQKLPAAHNTQHHIGNTKSIIEIRANEEQDLAYLKKSLESTTNCLTNQTDSKQSRQHLKALNSINDQKHDSKPLKAARVDLKQRAASVQGGARGL